MKKQRLGKYWILLLTLAMLSINCENDETIVEHEHPASENSDILIETIGFDQLTDDPSSVELVKKLENKKKSLDFRGKNGKGKGIEIMEGLTIRTNSIKKIIDGENVSWTFNVVENNIESSVFENFLAKKFEGTFSYFLISYEIDQEANTEFPYRSYCYHIPEQYIELDEQNLSARDDDFDFAPPSGGAGCVGTVRYIIEPCNRGGTHVPKYCCQHSGGVHGCGNGKPCSYTCTGTWISSIIFDFSHCGLGSTGGGTFNDGNGNDPSSTSGGNNGGTSDSGSTITSPLTYADGTTVASNLISSLSNSLGSSQISWLNNSINQEIVFKLNTYLNKNGNSINTRNFIKWVVEFSMQSIKPCGAGHDCVKSIQHMANGLRKFHGEEGALMADYFDSLVADFNSFTKADLQEFYDLAKLVTNHYNDYMFGSITGAFTEGTAQILGVILFEVGGNAAVALLQKIPVSWVLKRSTLTPFVQNVAKLGIQGTQAHVRIVKTANPLNSSRSLFNALTQNAISKSTQSNGAIVANMGNGNFITFRTVSKSKFPTTIDLNFPNLFVAKQVIKFSL